MQGGIVRICNTSFMYVPMFQNNSAHMTLNKLATPFDLIPALCAKIPKSHLLRPKLQKLMLHNEPAARFANTPQQICSIFFCCC